jgi:hypothetical protein
VMQVLTQPPPVHLRDRVEKRMPSQDMCWMASLYIVWNPISRKGIVLWNGFFKSYLIYYLISSILSGTLILHLIFYLDLWTLL